jgi:cohesin loading factor subunit SCC2
LQSHVGFCRFLADNLAAFDYKTQEEVFVVIERLTAIISVTAAQLLDLLSRARFDFADDVRLAESQRVVVQVAARGRGLQQLTDLSSEAEEVRRTGLGASILRALILIYLRRSIQLGIGSDDTVRAHAGSNSTVSYDAQTLANFSIVCSLAFLLKSHLKALYQLSEDKCRKHDAAGKKSAFGDKAAVRRLGAALTLDLGPVPFALEDVKTLSDVAEQCLAVRLLEPLICLVEAHTLIDLGTRPFPQFITIAEEDGTNLEPDDDSA